MTQSSTPHRTVRVVAAVIQRNDRYLITQRRPTALLPLLWEFPGGKVEEGETDTEALRREVFERLGVEVVVGLAISSVNHAYEHYSVDLHLYECKLTSHHIHPHAINDYRWVTSRELDQYTFTPADEASMTQLLGVDIS